MNHRFLTIPFMALCLASCSGSGQDDPNIPTPPAPNPDLVSIDFGGNSGAWQDVSSSRATDNGLESLWTSFRVWGYKTTNNAPQIVMDGYNVEYKDNTAGSTTSNTADWEYVGITNTNTKTTQTIKYWDYSATDYRFFAYAPANANITSSETTSTEGNQQLSFSIPYTYNSETTANSNATPYVSELWFSDNNSNTPSDGTSGNTSENTHLYGKCVTLTFAPIIAKMRFKFTYPEDAEGITIKDIQFRDSRLVSAPTWAETPIKGDIIATYPLTGNTPVSLSWKTSSDKDSKGKLIFDIPYEDKDDKIQILPDNKPKNKWYYVPPLGSNSDFEQGSYTITAQIDGKETSATVPSAYMQWKAGYQYTYIFKITEAGTNIIFTDLLVEQWLTGQEFGNNGSGTAGW